MADIEGRLVGQLQFLSTLFIRAHTGGATSALSPTRGLCEPGFVPLGRLQSLGLTSSANPTPAASPEIVSARLPPQRNLQVYGSPRGETTSNSRWAQTGQYTVRSLAPSELSGSLTICAIQPGARWVTQPHSSQQSKAGS